IVSWRGGSTRKRALTLTLPTRARRWELPTGKSWWSPMTGTTWPCDCARLSQTRAGRSALKPAWTTAPSRRSGGPTDAACFVAAAAQLTPGAGDPHTRQRTTSYARTVGGHRRGFLDLRL